MSSDKLLEQTIEARLLREHQLSAFDIQIEATKGVVVLRGTVPTSRAKLAIHELTQSTPGCRDVVNELAIAPAKGVCDHDIAEHIRNLLDERPELTKGAITVQVEGGVVTLSGAVGTPEEYTIAEDVARSMRGVRDVHNLMLIDRDAQYDDESLQLEVQAALNAVRELHGADINVAVSSDLIVLSGRVRTPHQRDLAAEVAMGVRPWHIRNEIVVEHQPSILEP